MPSIEKRGANSWRLIVEGGPGIDGKRIQRRKTVKIEDEAILRSDRKRQGFLQMELARFQAEVESGSYHTPERTTFSEFVKLWKVNYADQHLGAYTRRNYTAILTSRLLPVFGSVELSKIKAMHLVSFIAQLRRKDSQKPLATNTVLNVYKVLKSVFDVAVKWQVLVVNPMAGVDRPIPDKEEKRRLKTRKHVYTLTESATLIDALRDEPEHWRLYFLGLLLGGFRRGELLGMQWSDVDFITGGLHVEKQISMSEDGKRVEAELKTEESAAFVAMPRWYMSELERFKKVWAADRLQIGDKWRGGEKQYLFHTGYGEPYYPTVPTYRWRKFLLRHDLPHVRLHDLRHTTAMLLREDGADLKAIQERLRHTRLSTTADLYMHESERAGRETADRLEKLSPNPSPVGNGLGTNRR